METPNLTPEEKKEKIKGLLANVKRLMELRDKQKELLKELTLAQVRELEGPFTIYEWNKRRAEVLYEMGLGHKPDRWTMGGW